MARVCTDLFLESNGFYMDDKLKLQLDVLLRNIKNDWDFTIIISGSGEVRVGKSMLGIQIAVYWTHQLEKIHKIKVPFSIKDNIIFEGKKLIEKGNYLGKTYPFSALLFDEAGADLEGRKSMQSQTQDVLDFYRECGQYNMLNILILPEFFDLPKGIALSRSIFLIDVYYTADETGLFQRGYFNFFSKRQKKYLYLIGKRDLNYKAVKYDFHGRYYKFYPLDEVEYRKSKQEALTKRESRRRNKFQMQRDAAWYLLWSEFNMTQENIGKRMEGLTGIFVPQNTISDALSHFKLENE